VEGWTAVSAALTVVFGLLSLLLYIRSRQYKRLTFTFDVSELHTRTHPGVKITFNDRQVENLSRLRAVCWNSGTQEIRREDLPKEGPRAVILSKATVLSVAHVGSTTDTAFSAVRHDDNSVAVEFAFLNPGDCGLFEVLYEATSPDKPAIQFHGRVIGGHRTETRLFSGPLKPVESVAAFALPAACLMAVYLSADFVRRSVKAIPNGFSIDVRAAMLVLVLIIGAIVSALVIRHFVRRVRESRLPGLAKDFFVGRSNKRLQPAAAAATVRRRG
jgi:hypothetical protein